MASTSTANALSEAEIDQLARAYAKSMGRDGQLNDMIQQLVAQGRLDPQSFGDIAASYAVQNTADTEAEKYRQAAKQSHTNKPPQASRQPKTPRQEPVQHTPQPSTTSQSQSKGKSLNWVAKAQPFAIALVIAGILNSILVKAGAPLWLSLPVSITTGLAVAFPAIGAAVLEAMQTILHGLQTLVFGKGRSLLVGAVALYFLVINCESWWMAMPGSQGAFVPKAGIEQSVTLANFWAALSDWKFYIACFLALGVNAIETLWLVDRSPGFLKAKHREVSGDRTVQGSSTSSAAKHYQKALQNAGMKPIYKNSLIAFIAFGADIYGSWQQFPLADPYFNLVHLVWGILVLLAPEGCFALAKTFYEDSKHGG